MIKKEAHRYQDVEISCWAYEQFHLPVNRVWLAPYDQPLTRTECKAEFCFYIADIINFLDVSGQPDPIVSSICLNVPALDGWCILLKYFVPVTQLSKQKH